VTLITVLHGPNSCPVRDSRMEVLTKRVRLFFQLSSIMILSGDSKPHLASCCEFSFHKTVEIWRQPI
jgi:hypothetical protein